MKSLLNHFALVVLACTVLTSSGCQSLPWIGRPTEKSKMLAQQYAEQAAANIQYDDAIDYETGYLPPAKRLSSSAPTAVSSRPSWGGGSY